MHVNVRAFGRGIFDHDEKQSNSISSNGQPKNVLDNKECLIAVIFVVNLVITSESN